MKIKWIAAFWVLAFSLWCGQKTNAQMVGTPYPTPKGCTNVATEGQDFWVTFGLNSTAQNANQVYLALQLVNGNSSPVTVTLTFTYKTGPTNTATYTVPANSSQQVDLSNVSVAGGATTVSLGAVSDLRGYVYQTSLTTVTNNMTLRITCPAIISVIAFNTQNATTAASILLPTTVWGTDYYNLSYIAANGYQNTHLIIANQNNTNVTVTDNTGTTQATATLSAGQVWYYVPPTPNQDLTGMHITSDKPVAYFMHNTASAGAVTGDMLSQQLASVPNYGQYFLVPNQTQFNTTGNASNATNLVRVLATQDNTTISFTNALSMEGNDGYTLANGYVSTGIAAGSAVSSVTLNKGQWTEVRIAGGQNSYCTVAANQPVGVVNYMQNGRIYNPTYAIGDGDDCRISPVTSMVYSAVIAPFIPPSSFPRGGSSNLAIVTNRANGTSGAYDPTSNPITPRHYALVIAPTASKNNVTISRNGAAKQTLTAAAAAVSSTAATAPTTWTDVTTPINGVLYSYIRYDFDYQRDAAASYRIDNPNSGFLITQAGMGFVESYTFNSGNGGCLVNY